MRNYQRRPALVGCIIWLEEALDVDLHTKRKLVIELSENPKVPKVPGEYFQKPDLFAGDTYEVSSSNL